MIPRTGLALSLSSLILGSAAQLIPTEECPILGPAFPAIFDPSETTAIKQAKEIFPSLIDALFDVGVFNKSELSIAINVFSTHTNDTVYSYFHSGDALEDDLTTDKLDDETIFRIGSVSKLYTVYAILAKAGLDIFDHPVTNYLPELAGNGHMDFTEKIRWEDVTVGALAAQQGGSGGIPIELYECLIVGTKECSTREFLEYMRDNKRPVIPPWQAATYSDAGFAILGRVLERVSGLPYNDALKTLLVEPLGLKSTSALEPKGDDLNALIVGGGMPISSWGSDNQIIASSGGVYSNNKDLRTTGLSILNSQILSPTDTRTWMKPRGHTGTLLSSVGAPWEINRLTIPVSPNSNRTRVSDLYTKLGGNNGYSATLALSPDHGLGFSVLVAGQMAIAARAPLRNIVGEVFLVAAEHAAYENAQKNFAGTFLGDSDDGTNITLTVDEGRPGLGLAGWFEGSVDWRANTTQPLAPQFPAANLSIRLYPNGVVSPFTSLASTYASEGTIRMSFRAVPQFVPFSPRGEMEGGQGLFDSGCEIWASVGFFDSFDEFELEVVDGKVTSVRSLVSGTVMKRVGEKKEKSTHKGYQTRKEMIDASVPWRG